MTEKKFVNCWACGSLCKNIDSPYKRIEYHHVWGKAENDFTVPLCIICHDLIDRSRLEDTYEAYFESIPQINELLKLQEDENGKYKHLKLLILKFLKISLSYSKDRTKSPKCPHFAVDKIK